MKPIDFIEMLRNSDPYISTIYTNGSCYKFHLILKKMYPESVPMIDEIKDHIVTEIDGVYYDINGVNNGEYYSLTDYDFDLVEKWSFSKQRMLQIGECPVCEEPIVV